MPRTPASFKQGDVTRALRGAVAAGIQVARIEIDPRTGHIIILTPQVLGSPIAPYDAWKAVRNAS